jgi:hypothetical protein
MKLLNFQPSQASFSVELVGRDFTWDLHNAGTFLGLKLKPNDNTLVMSWSIEGHPSSKYLGCDLVFAGLKLLTISSRDEVFPYSEDACVSAISKVIPGTGEKAGYRVKREWAASEPFHFLFHFQSGREIEVNAETVKLLGIALGSAGQSGL